MVSKASDDFPDPETPVMTVIWLWGIESEISFRLWTRARRIRMKSCTGVVLVSSSIACAVGGCSTGLPGTLDPGRRGLFFELKYTIRGAGISGFPEIRQHTFPDGPREDSAQRTNDLADRRAPCVGRVRWRYG